MSFEETIRAAVRDEVRLAVREVLAPVIAKLAEAASDGEFLSVSGAAKFLGASRAGVRKWIAEGRLPRYRAGKAIRVRRGDLLAFLQQEEQGGGRRTIDEQVTSILSGVARR